MALDSNYTPRGRHLIAGEWVMGDATFKPELIDGEGPDYSVGRVADVDAAVEAAEEAFWTYGYTTRETRAAFLNAIADEIDARGDAITAVGTLETGLPAARLEGERGRTTGQLRLFASHILAGDYLDHRVDEALPDRAPLPRPHLEMVQRPIGPVAVFGASNFPLAFSTAGGDTAAALAAGCPVVVKGHSAHPGTGEIVAEAILVATKSCDMPAGVFSLVHGGRRDVGTRLVQHPLIKAVGFTGSLAGGRALFDLCAQRPEPIPFFGELGSVNPVFILPEAANARIEDIANGWAASLTMCAGQFCTNPGIILVPETAAEAFVTTAQAALDATADQHMLTLGIAGAYRDGVARMADADGVTQVMQKDASPRDAAPALYTCDMDTWLGNHALSEEVFGPLGLVVTVKDVAQMRELARTIDGQLTCTLIMDNGDIADAQSLMPILERKAGRILANGFPTGVEVADTMVHGGPYPASTNFGATSVGTLSIRRFLRPVCYQNLDAALLPK